MKKEEYEELAGLEEEMESCKDQVISNKDFERCEFCNNIYCHMNPNQPDSSVFTF